MAAPPQRTIKDLNGRWLMNKGISGSTEDILAFQGIGWLTRKAVGLASVTLTYKQYEAPSEANPAGPPVPHIDIEQTATGGIKGTSEHRTLDWTEREHSDWLFGDLKAKSRFTTISAILKGAEGKTSIDAEDAKYITEGWLDEKDGEITVVESLAVNENAGWTGWQLWGFSSVNGERWSTRRVVFRKLQGNDVLRTRLVYEWLGESE